MKKMLDSPVGFSPLLFLRLIPAFVIVVLGVLVVAAPVASADEGSAGTAPDQAEVAAELPGAQPAAQVDTVADSFTMVQGMLPVLLRLPTIGVEMEVEVVGTTVDGSMAAPVDPDRAGWYQYGPLPGDPGNAAIAGHVDWAGRVRPFWYLRRLQEGDPVEVVSADGQTFEFQVQWLRWYEAYDAPIEEIFGSTDVPEVTLITCGGTFDYYNHEYLSRLVVRAAMPTP